ncbi:MAG: N-acetyltransferase family protein [Candidatus Sulfotelmatobacter sp.]
MDFQTTFMRPEDWPSVCEIYHEGIATGNATFETELPDWEKWDRSHRQDCRLVAREGELIVGWAALSSISSRRVYSGVAEVSVYVAAAARGQGVGNALLKALIDESERQEIWTLQAGIFPENLSSIALHKTCGFREIGVRRRIGKLGEGWRDVLLLERRSTIIGT